MTEPDPPFALVSEPAFRPKPPPPVSGWSIQVACNNTQNGRFAGRANMFELVAPDGDIALSMTEDDGSAVKFAERLYGDPPQLLIRFGGKRRLWFRTLRREHWAGNWCWNRYWFSDRAIVRILRFLWEGFGHDGGWCVLTDPLEESGESRTITLRLLKAALAAPRED